MTAVTAPSMALRWEALVLAVVAAAVLLLLATASVEVTAAVTPMGSRSGHD
jgi:hypothetical protein